MCISFFIYFIFSVNYTHRFTRCNFSVLLLCVHSIFDEWSVVSMYCVEAKK